MYIYFSSKFFFILKLNIFFSMHSVLKRNFFNQGGCLTIVQSSIANNMFRSICCHVQLCILFEMSSQKLGRCVSFGYAWFEENKFGPGKLWVKKFRPIFVCKSSRWIKLMQQFLVNFLMSVIRISLLETTSWYGDWLTDWPTVTTREAGPAWTKNVKILKEVFVDFWLLDWIWCF